ncbi:hypothetical protein NLJ89_g1451 [Agrocybe chaxingu]|uniref:Uncharacterized protein n=1 Tax=Agrocybe chaxingu TaxID=84603 RepID=A0A9W8MZY8_9AGAR|nr:hypothetical protein NLJ89_g1451 [Agrocybe chaxingu]
MMDNPAHNHHVYDPTLANTQQNSSHEMVMNGGTMEVVQEQPVQEVQMNGSTASSSGTALNPDGTPVKRRPGRPKGSTKKNLLTGSPLPAKIKRPVGRPRKDGLPAGSVGPARVKKEKAQVFVTGVGYPQPAPYGYSVSAPIFKLQIDPALENVSDNGWAELARMNPNAFLGTLLTALAAPNPVSTAGPTVEEAFKAHLVSLAPNPQQMQPIPSLYYLLKTFWVPSSPAYFSLTASTSTARTPSEHRFFYWDPLPLVFNGIGCPSCAAPLINKGRIASGPVKIYDIEKPFFIIGCEYVCRSAACLAATSSLDGRNFASTDPSILRSLPARLKDEFPARVLNSETDAGSGGDLWNWKAMGVSTGLWNLVMGSLRAGLKKEVILALVLAVQHGAPDLASETTGQQPQPSQNGNHQDDRMGVDEGSGDEEGGDHAAHEQDASERQTMSSTSFSETYTEAWKENTAMAEAAPKQASASSAPPPIPPAHLPALLPAPSLPPPPPPPPAGYNPYTAYPFPSYHAYMPHQIVNGQIVPIAPLPPPGLVAAPSAPPNAQEDKRAREILDTVVNVVLKIAKAKAVGLSVRTHVRIAERQSARVAIADDLTKNALKDGHKSGEDADGSY